MPELTLMTKALGIALVHSLWQGLLFALLCGLVLKAISIKYSNLRYWVSFLSLLLLFSCFAGTFGSLYYQLSTVSVSTQGAEASQATEVLDLLLLNGAKEENLLDGAGEFVQKVYTLIYPYTSYLAILWLAGVCLFCIRLVADLLYVEKIKSTHTLPASKFWREKAETLARQIGVSNSFRLLQSTTVQVPTLVGWLRPVILIPTSLFTFLTVEELESILLHELAHIKRHDYLLNILQSIIEIFMFYHPVVWWLSANVHTERENCCDDLTVNALGGTMLYAKALTHLAEWQLTPHALTLSAIGSKPQLLNRIKRMIYCQNNHFIKTKNTNLMKNSAKIMAAILVLLSLGGIITGFKPVNNEQTLFTEQKQQKVVIEAYVPISEKRTEEAFPSASSLQEEEKSLHFSIPTRKGVELIKEVEIDEEQQVVELHFEPDTGNVKPEPLYIVNGKEVKKLDVVPEDIQSVYVLKGKKALKAYGKKGKNGVVEITLKSKDAQEKIIEVLHSEEIKTEEGQKLISEEAVQVLDENGVIEVALEGHEIEAREEVEALRLPTPAETGAQVHPLYIVDGEEVMELTLEPQDIQSIEVLKGKSAVKAYGEKGKNGVVLVTLKKKHENEIIEVAVEEPEKSNVAKEELKSTESSKPFEFSESLVLFPNPTKDEATIRFRLLQKEKVAVVVYNAEGKKLETILDQELGAGKHKVTWNNQDQSSGMYILKIFKGKEVFQKKLFLSK
ncbi:M56 family metallopeptidase [Rapidithrix thailandica]|uniref:M56 family metallopeptidase n=1 Tax=Rapidithrix thailandica TaxID=413964 RepID=A0AAW9SB62_9BACT